MSELTVNECKRIMSTGRIELSAAQKRIDELESLVRDMGAYIDGIANRTYTVNVAYGNDLLDRMAELGIEVSE